MAKNKIRPASLEKRKTKLINKQTFDVHHFWVTFRYYYNIKVTGTFLFNRNELLTIFPAFSEVWTIFQNQEGVCMS